MPNSLPPLNLLKAFEIAARHLSVSRTAKELCITQAAVSRQIIQLEDHLDTKLFQRTNRGLLLTESGEQFGIEVTKAMDIVRQAVATVNPKSSDTESYRLLLGVDTAFAQAWLVKRLSLFYRDYADIEIEMVMSKPLADLSHHPIEGVDVQVVYGAGPWSGFQADKLLEFEEYPVCSPNMEAIGALNSPHDLKHFTLLHEESHYGWRRWLNFVEESGVDWKLGPIIHDSMSCLSMAAEGDGLAIGDNLTCDDFFKEGLLIKPFNDVMPLKESFYLLIEDSKNDHYPVKIFRDWLLLQMQSLQ